MNEWNAAYGPQLADQGHHNPAAFLEVMLGLRSREEYLANPDSSPDPAYLTELVRRLGATAE